MKRMTTLMLMAALATYAMAISSTPAATGHVKTILLSQERYVEMKQSIDKTGQYLFLDYDVALVLTNAPAFAPNPHLPPLNWQIPPKDTPKKKPLPKKPEPNAYVGQR